MRVGLGIGISGYEGFHLSTTIDGNGASRSLACRPFLLDVLRCVIEATLPLEMAVADQHIATAITSPCFLGYVKAPDWLDLQHSRGDSGLCLRRVNIPRADPTGDTSTCVVGES